MTKKGEPYGPKRYKEIVKERYVITKNTNTSYGDTGNITPLERQYLLSFIEEDLKRTKENLEKARPEAKKSIPPRSRFPM